MAPGKGSRFQRQTSSHTIGFPRGGAYFIDQLRDIDFTDRAAGKAIVWDGTKYIFATAGGTSGKSGSGNPNGVVTPDGLAQMYLDTDINSDGGHDVYISTSISGKKRQQLYVVPSA